jgi:hypothetical protein
MEAYLGWLVYENVFKTKSIYNYKQRGPINIENIKVKRVFNHAIKVIKDRKRTSNG